jgi:hypothetical protein
MLARGCDRAQEQLLDDPPGHPGPVGATCQGVAKFAMERFCPLPRTPRGGHEIVIGQSAPRDFDYGAFFKKAASLVADSSRLKTDERLAFD